MCFRRVHRNLTQLRMGCGQKFAYLLLHRPIVSLALEVKNDVSVRIDEIAIGPDVRTVGAPDGALEICHYGPGQLETLRRLAHIVGVVSHPKFAEMHADNVETVGMVFGVPALQDAEIADAIDAGVLPEVDQQNPSAIALDGMGHFLARRARVDSLRIGAKVWRLDRGLILGARRSC
jgi:hypothetical protein